MTAHSRRQRDYSEFATEGWSAAERQAIAVRTSTGCDLMPRGEALARYVLSAMMTRKTAHQITKAVGYSVDRCAQLLASAHHAPLARRLLSRAAFDEVIIRTPEPDPEPVAEHWVTRPTPTIPELLDELEDARERGADWETVAHMFAIDPDSLVRQIERAGVLDKVRFWHPTFRRARRSMLKPSGLCPEGHPVVRVGAVKVCRVCEVAA